jgi:purine-binding chemotaxis protein CheW
VSGPLAGDASLSDETLYGGAAEDLATEGALDSGAVRRLLAFTLGGELYGVPLHNVTEIRELLPLTPLPHVASHVLGLVNLRGLVLPVVDLGRKYGFAPAAGPENRLLILKGAGYLVALLVDAVSGIARIPEAAFQPAPAAAGRLDAEHCPQVAAFSGRLLIEIDVPRMLEATALAGAGARPSA